MHTPLILELYNDLGIIFKSILVTLIFKVIQYEYWCVDVALRYSLHYCVLEDAWGGKVCCIYTPNITHRATFYTRMQWGWLLGTASGSLPWLDVPVNRGWLPLDGSWLVLWTTSALGQCWSLTNGETPTINPAGPLGVSLWLLYMINYDDATARGRPDTAAWALLSRIWTELCLSLDLLFAINTSHFVEHFSIKANWTFIYIAYT